ncbi:MMPL family transporter [Halobacteriales archaeon Cl-PHB]
MSLPGRIADAIAQHSKVAIALMVLLTVVVGAGAPMVSSASSLDQFQADTPEEEKLNYIEENFTAGEENTTVAQVVVRGDNVLSRDSLISALQYEQTLQDNGTVGDQLVDTETFAGVPNFVGIAAVRGEQFEALQENFSQLERDQQRLEERQTELQTRQQNLNETLTLLRGGLDELRQNRSKDPDATFSAIQQQAPVTMNQTQRAIFVDAAEQLRNARSEEEAQAAYQQGTQGVLQSEFAALQERADALEAEGADLQERAEELQDRRETLAEADQPTLDEQIDQLESMNDSEVEALVGDVLAADGSGNGTADSRLFALMPTDYDPGETQANATMLVVTMESPLDSSVSGAAAPETIDAQLSMRSLGEAQQGTLDYLVFGSGIIAHEIDASMQDSMTIVGPLALLFVLITLAIAYRDLLDILLGVLGIGVVLLWTFGFMGWAGFSFNQIFIAVPVLLIGLSIDYAIHIFMRHREQREELSNGPRGSMGVALTGVGVALVWVTATTAIGFLSNLTSPVRPIQEFGITSAVGIVAALLVFGVLIPALKVELDELLEGWGLDRTKRAFGTGGGRLGAALSVGASGARRAPLVILALVLLVTAAGAYGGTQIDTEFNQEDFLADDPPQWMKDLPEPFSPSKYTAKSNLNYVNDRFVREDAQAEFLIEGSVTADNTLDRLDAAVDRAADEPVTLTLSTGDPAVASPLSVIDRTAATNASFNETVTAADTDGDGIPDRNLTAVFDHLYEVAPDTAEQYVHRVDGKYLALRMTVSVDGGAGSSDVRDQMEAVAASLDGNGLTVTATGSAILNAIVSDQLLDTVVESLIITLVVVFLFLMAAYRFTDGSAILGAVTLTPVALAVAWILGSMYLMGIPFNVLTGMITSLTIGLGVAYSIHLSERYTLELDRRDSVWEAMHTAVTGTGGALLGSAATTVGGFGVLVFSILPPLQQFGLIAGLSIVFAFLGSVVVLPTLLALWTRYFGPEWARGQVADGDWGTEPDEEGATVEVAGETATETTSAGTAAGTASEAAGREVATSYAGPGEWVDVTVRLPAGSSRVVLRESFDGDLVDLETVSPEPAARSQRGSTLFVAWEPGDERLELTYAAAVPAQAENGATYGFDGTVVTEAGEATLDGDATVTVDENVYRRVVENGRASDADLAAATERFESGDLTAGELEQVYRVWLDGEAKTGDAAEASSIDEWFDDADGE